MSGWQIIIFLKNNHLVKDSRQKKINLGGEWMNESRTVNRKKQRAKNKCIQLN